MFSSNMGDVLARRAARNPTKEAVVDTTTGERLTYRQLDDRANQTGHALDALGVKPGDRVALLLSNSIEFMESFYGSAKIGGIVVLLNWRLVADELEYLLVNSGAATLVFGDNFAPVVSELRTRGTTAVTNWVQVVTGSAPTGAAAGGASDWSVDFHSLRSVASAASPGIRAGGDDVLCLCYSSGTTGLPKGAMLTHEGQMWAVFSNLGSSEDFNLSGRYLMVMPMFHLGGLLPMEVAIFGGSTVVIMKAFDPNGVWDVVGRERITSGLVVPAMLSALLNVYDAAKHDHTSIKNLWCAAAPLPVTLIEQCMAKGIGLLQTYGLTESGGPGSILGHEDAVRKVGSSGKAYMLTEVRVVRSDGTDCDPEEAGELLVRSRHVMKGYWNNPEATASTVVDGWLHTGDVATMDSESFVTIQDRMKDMIISGGENIYPAELENVILSHPGVREVAVVAQPSARWGESPLAVVVRTADDSGTALRAEDVLAWCDGKLARFKQPKSVEFIDEVPRNASGKALKRLLRERFPAPAKE
jgi:acyl-CoA synthetase (AMP-forming)/AMP-acid ligase II